MNLIFACLLTVLGTLWTPEHGFQLFAHNDTKTPLAVTAVTAIYLKPGATDSGDVPDPRNLENKTFTIAPVVVPPGSDVTIPFPLAIDQQRFFDAGAQCAEAI